ncbi:MAG: PKD domain-containing protein, partial [Candidatus Nanoarchaeia archaeon]
IFNDKTADIGNNKINNATACGFLKNYGCFNLGQTSANFNVAKLPNKYCQKIKLSPSPGFKIGGWIKNISNTNKKLSIGIYTLSGDELKKCSLPGVPEGDGQETSCDIEYLVMEPEDYYVCIYDNGEGGSDGDFQIKGYSSSENACGYYGAGVGSETASYQIFAEGKRFDSIGTLEITNSLPNGDTLNSAVQEYIAERYGSLDCSINNCVVPINLISEQNQAITLENLEIKYSTISGQITDNKFYDISESVSTLSTDDFQKLKLDSGGFTLPSNKGNTTFELNLNSQKIFSQIVAVGDVPTIKGLTPTTTVAILPTEFEVIVEYSGNITKYEWDFGDGKTQTTSSNKVVHGYNSTGEYELKITVADINQKESSKKFIINVGSPQDVAKNTIDKMLIDLSNVKTQINALPLFQQENLNLLLDIENTEADIMQIQRDYASASSEETYKQIMASLLELDVPESIRTSRSANSVLFYSERGKINLDELIAVAGGEYNYEDREKYIDSIFAWNQENLETKITFEEISAKYENFEIPVLRVFKMDINE